MGLSIEFIRELNAAIFEVLTDFGFTGTRQQREDTGDWGNIWIPQPGFSQCVISIWTQADATGRLVVQVTYVTSTPALVDGLFVCRTTAHTLNDIPVHQLPSLLTALREC